MWLGGKVTRDEISNEERERLYQHYPWCRAHSTPRVDFEGKEECSAGGKHNWEYIGWSETIGHYYNCRKCHNRS